MVGGEVRVLAGVSYLEDQTFPSDTAVESIFVVKGVKWQIQLLYRKTDVLETLRDTFCDAASPIGLWYGRLLSRKSCCLLGDGSLTLARGLLGDEDCAILHWIVP